MFVFSNRKVGCRLSEYIYFLITDSPKQALLDRLICWSSYLVGLIHETIDL